MIIRIDSSRVVRVDEPGSFKAFKVAVAAPRSAFDSIAAANPGVVRFDDAATAWVSIAALRTWHGLQDQAFWQEGLAAMIAKAKPHGWISPDDASIKAHVVWED